MIPAPLITLCAMLCVMGFIQCTKQVSEEGAVGQSSAPAPALRNTYWKLLSVEGQAIVLAPRQREPSLVLRANALTLHGHTGCNQMSGEFALTEGQGITFGTMAVTRKACVPHVQEQEQRFLKALENVQFWRLEGQALILQDALKQDILVFQAVYLP